MFEIIKDFPDGLIKLTGRPKGSKSLTDFMIKGYCGTQKDSKLV